MSETLPQTPFPLAVTPATAETFQPFGALVAVPRDGERVSLPVAFAGEAPLGEARMAMNAVAPPDGPLPLLIERHPSSVQIFVPLGPEPLLAVVATADLDRPAASDFRAFAIPPRHAVVYRAGTWHLGLSALAVPTAVAVFIRRMADGRDTEIIDLEGALRIVV